MRAQRRTSGPGACRGMAGFARHALVFRSRRLHDLDQEMQEIQEIQERPCGATAKPLCKAATAAASCYGTSQTCRGAGEAWMLGSLAFSLYNYFACRPLVGRSVLRGRGRFGPLGLHALFSVLQGAKAPFPCRGVGQRPTSNRQSVNLPSSQSPLCSLCPFERFVIKTHSGSSCPSCLPRRVNLPHSPNTPPVARLSRVLFSVLRSLFSWVAVATPPVLRGASAPLPISHPGFSRKTQRRKGWAR